MPEEMASSTAADHNDAPGRLEMITQLSPKHSKSPKKDTVRDEAADLDRVWQKAEIATAADRKQAVSGREAARKRFFAKSHEIAAFSEARSKTPVRVERVAGKHIITGMDAPTDLSVHTANVSTHLINALVEERVSRRQFRSLVDNSERE